jgi:hypothetical protein
MDDEEVEVKSSNIWKWRTSWNAQARLAMDENK